MDGHEEQNYFGMSSPLFPWWDDTELPSFFNESELFAGVDRTDERSKTLKYPAGSFIFSPEISTFDKVYILKKGRIVMFRLLASGRRLAMGEIQPGIVFGIMGVLGRTVQKNIAQAAEDCLVSAMSKEKFIYYLDNNPAMTRRLVEASYWLINIMEDRIIDIVYNPVRSRLANFLLNNANQATGIIKSFTQEEIGDTIGATRQVVTENLNQMRKEGLLLIKRKEIQILDRRGLSKVLSESER
jgi:CRP-like cAMP-binding protein